MRIEVRWIVLALVAALGSSCRHEAGPPPPSETEIQGIQAAVDAYLAYQHADCETVYRLTQPSEIDGMQATELRHSLRLVRGFCQEIDGDQPEARRTYRRLIDEAPGSFAAADARERLRILDLLADDPAFAMRIERVAKEGIAKDVAPREPDVRPDALYPPLARASQIEGFAVVDYGIARNGRTVDPIVVDSNPPFLFEGTALRAVRSWEYKSKRSADPNERHAIRIFFRPGASTATLSAEGTDRTDGSAEQGADPSDATATGTRSSWPSSSPAPNPAP